MGKRLGHLKTVTKHRRYVRKACFKMGLYYQGITHDLSKFSYTELKTGFKYYVGTSSPIDQEKKDKGYSYGWQHHHNKNPHHWEYWLDFLVTTKETNINGNIVKTKESNIYAVKMPFKYVLELVADFIGAGQAYNGKAWNNSMPLEYYIETIDRRIIHEDSKALMYFLFTLIARPNINYKKTLKQIKQNKKHLKKIYESNNTKQFSIIE